ncbi:MULTISPECIES: glycosyltransferase family 1 protein [Cryobacterium]|uniref:Glycosyltransferase family 1 protein n=1 Tax=Cryobacterium breve TaxID=1259258 RepID=A0ABY2J4L3_9MICO|nr:MULTISPECIES: glycosyltransferase family 1 protein [Cryobacterium]TFC94116.1 glycosyltransferase family 1 protein [Cryobacterium sp. TmT3-12]TFC98653.1 glycosyltransferase family 1 protein [Cryobacterium breve]
MAALVGFVYPGKGHREVIDAVARMGAVLDVAALGAASAGHEADLIALASHAESLGITFTATGYISDDELFRLCRLAAVPIAAHQHLSASGSILAWLAAGRRPLVADSRYAREMQALRPGSMTLYAANAMEAAIVAALSDPRSTILPTDIDTAPHLPHVVTSYREWWNGLAW